MKILFISQYFHPEPLSNTDLAKSMIANGHDVDVLTSVPNYPEGKFYSGYSNTQRRFERWCGMNVARSITVPRGQSSFYLMLNYLVYPAAALINWWPRRRQAYDVSFTSMPSPIFQALVAIVIRAFARVPAVYWVQDIWPDSLVDVLGIRNRALRWLLLRLCGWIYRRGDLVLIQSEAFRPKLESMGVAPERIAFLPNSSPSGFTPLALEDVDADVKAMIPPAALRLMFAGNVGESQNIDVYIEAARLLGDMNVQWVIVGHGRDFERVRAAVMEAGCDEFFVFTGRQPMARMPHFYALADAMLVSLKDTEIFRITVPFKLQSYLALGKPVIGSIGGEAKRIIAQSGAGFCAEPEDAQALADAVRRFAATSCEERGAMGKAATAYFEKNYSQDRVYAMLNGALERTARDGRRVPVTKL